MSKKLLIYRKKRPEFNSIENVFNALTPFLNIDKIELPFFSIGIINRLKNTFFIKKKKAKLNHITGNDHYLALGLSKKTVILTIHDIEILKRTTGLKKYILKKIWFDWPIKKSSIITTISEFTKSELLQINNYKTPIVVIPDPLTLSIKYSPKTFHSECPVILHLGIKANKNLPQLIEALNGINCKLVIIGKSNNIILQQLKENDIDFTFKTNVSNDEIIQEFQACDLLSFASIYEGFGLPIIEAQAMGRVVITSNVASMPEVAGDGAYFVDPFDASSIKEGILELINNTNLRKELILKGLENVKRFEPQKIANQYQELYNSIK
ncbi:glycosyltransferase family 4 protein [Vicingus serpentipes]|uniref:Glycosyltransferase family 4 protein n=1 Tax=Vicingus serpentipes TaxID=1926625 RepID=A0A5C6RNA9_9FLAO|nr:glycosyltransferase family 1 protein [Vicingus serpentipes]TXB63713.1 glycosyltransferase family 4 protein [Vicingus serpentipes]